MNNLEVKNLNKELERLEYFEDILGTAIVNRNGLLISSRLPRNIDERRFGAMAASCYFGIETAASTIGASEINHLTVEFNEYQLIIMEADENLILVSLVDYNANLGLIFIEIEESIKNIKQILNR